MIAFPRAKRRAAAVLCICAVIGLAAYALTAEYRKLEPTAHFAADSLPVLASPEPAASFRAAAADGGGDAGLEAARAASSNGERIPAADDADEEQQVSSFNLLLLGLDSRSGEASRTDVIMLANIRPQDRQVTLVSIPRDTQVEMEGIGRTKINHAHLIGEARGGSRSGTDSTIQAVSNLCGCDIHYAMKVDFEGFERIIDTIGGVEVELADPVALRWYDSDLPAGKHHLDGKLTLALVRERYGLKSGDTGRQANQAMVLKAAAAKLLEPDNIVKLPTLIKQFRELLSDTNMTDRDFASLALLAVDFSPSDIAYVQLPGRSGRALDPLVRQELYYWVPDREAWNELADALFT